MVKFSRLRNKEKNNTKYDLALDGRTPYNEWLDLFITHWNSLGKHLQIDQGEIEAQEESVSARHKILRFSSENIGPFSDKALKTAFLERSRHSSGLGGRYCCPCWTPYDRLAANVDSLMWCRSISSYHGNAKHFVLPFFFDASKQTVTTDGLDELCHWVAKNALTPITHEEARALYLKFIRWIDDEVMDNDPSWRQARGGGS